MPTAKSSTSVPVSSTSAPAAALRPIKKSMAAKRSEIAVRIFRDGTELNLRTVAVFAHEHDRLVRMFRTMWFDYHAEPFHRAVK